MNKELTSSSSSSQTIFYNIHDFINIKVNFQGRFKSNQAIDMLSSFKVTNQDEITLNVNIGKFEPKLENCRVVNYRTYISDDYIYSSGKIKNFKYKIEYIDAFSSNPTINIEYEFTHLLKKLYHYAIAQSIFIVPLIEYYLLNKNIAVIHAAALSDESQAFVLFGRGGVYKTSLAMDLERQGNMNFLSDDKILIGEDKKVYSFPTFSEIFSFRKNHLKNENIRFTKKLLFLFKIYNNSHETMKVHSPKVLNSLFSLTKNLDPKKNVVPNLNNKELINSLMKSYRLEKHSSQGIGGYSSGLFEELLISYSFIFPESPTTLFDDKYLQIIKNIFNERNYKGLSTDVEYSVDYYNRVLENINVRKVI